MILTQQILSFFNDGQAHTCAQVAKGIGAKKDEAHLLESTLHTLCVDGELLHLKHGGYILANAAGYIKGTYCGLPGGGGFADFDGQDSLFIPQSKAGGALDGDTVLVCPKHGARNGGKPEGEIARILVRANTTVVGTVESYGGKLAVVPDNRRIPLHFNITRASRKNAVIGNKVVCRIVSYGESPDCEITEVLGSSDDICVNLLGVIRSHGLHQAFPQEVLDEADSVSHRPIDMRGRADLRGERIFTIDGDDARDFDDAVSVFFDGSNYILKVHIADVSSYVRAGSALDTEAQKRTTSVYFPGKVLPMLPEALSCGCCSLNPNEDRAALTAQMTVNKQGKTVAFSIYPSVIRSCARLTYRKVAALLRNESGLPKQYYTLRDDLLLAHKLYKILEQKRKSRGCIDFALPESQFELDKNGNVLSVRPEPREDSNRMIEQFMLEANECVAMYMLEHNLPAVYRIHEQPDSAKTAELNELLAVFGYRLGNKDGKVTPTDCANLLKKLQGKPEELLISRMLLRSMKKARYSEVNSGHFGLAADCYLHFTSPIRRYPDLLVHRYLKNSTAYTGQAKARDAKHLHELAAICSAGELEAAEAERDGDDIYRAQYAKGFIGCEFNGIVSGMSANAMWVELDNTLEGVIPLSYITDDRYNFDKRTYAMIGERTRKVYRFGDKIRVRIVNVNIPEGRIDMAPADMGKHKKGGKSKPAKPANKTKPVKLPKKENNGKPAVHKRRYYGTERKQNSGRNKNTGTKP